MGREVCGKAEGMARAKAERGERTLHLGNNILERNNLLFRRNGWTIWMIPRFEGLV